MFIQSKTRAFVRKHRTPILVWHAVITTAAVLTDLALHPYVWMIAFLIPVVALAEKEWQEIKVL
jgi:hypothetical protein